jgi:competence protein ComEA
MNNNVQKIFLSVAIAVSLVVTISPSYAKDETDKNLNTSKVEKATEKEGKSKPSKKDSSSENNRSRKATKDSGDNNSTGDAKKGGSKTAGKADSNTNRDSNKNTNSAIKNSKKEDNTNSNKQLKPTEKNKGKRGANTAKKQFKNIIVHLNKADTKTFSYYLMGIGEVKAKAIIAYRKENGKFKNLEGLLKVDGIGKKVFAGLKKNISLTKGEISAPKDGQSTTKKTK